MVNNLHQPTGDLRLLNEMGAVYEADKRKLPSARTKSTTTRAAEGRPKARLSN
jgi:hypothetical protein